MTNDLFITEDGSHSLFNKELDETYHSIHGAVMESQYVYIGKGLDFIQKRSNPEHVNILEIGFGTGLNALLTLQHIAIHPGTVNYTTVEAFPLGKEIWSLLNYGTTPQLKNWFVRLHEAHWETWEELRPNFNLLKIKNTVQHVALEQNQYDVIYFDAFAPNKQPEMWTQAILEKVIASMAKGAVFVTYCAKGQLKRDLKSLGLAVESLPGPPGKMEMVRATKDNN